MILMLNKIRPPNALSPHRIFTLVRDAAGRKGRNEKDNIEADFSKGKQKNIADSINYVCLKYFIIN